MSLKIPIGSTESMHIRIRHQTMEVKNEIAIANPRKWSIKTPQGKTIAACEIMFEYHSGIVRFSTEALDTDSREKALLLARSLDSHLSNGEYR